MNTANKNNQYDPHDKLNALVCFLKEQSNADEVWKELPIGYGFYFISNQGRVLSLYNNVPRVLKAFKCNDYYYVSIAGKDRRINRLVAKAFIENPECKAVVHHRDNNKLNNELYNLQWATHQENTEEYFKYLDNQAKENIEKLA